MTALTLGPITFEAFEIPARIDFGGGQRLCLHNLPGGVRVVDVMGGEDAPILWSGVFTGPNAGERVRQLDLLRSVGEPLLLIWDEFVFEVVVAAFEVRFEQPNWIPYRIVCVTLSDLSSPQLLALSLGAELGADIATAAGYSGLDLQAASLALTAPGAATLGGVAYGQSGVALAQAAAQAIALRDAGGIALEQARDVPQAAAAAGQMANGAAATGYLQRAQGNLARAGS